MKTLILTVILMTKTLLVFSQSNLHWLTILKEADENLQLTLIQNQFIGQSTNTDSIDMPILIVDGVPISSNEKTREFFLNDLTADKVDIKVLDKEPEGLYIEKRFTGIILITITDKRTRKKFRRLG